MRKYLTKNPSNIHRVQDNYERYVKDVEEKAKKDTEELRKEIEYYKANDWDTIEKKIIDEVNSLTIEELHCISKEDFKRRYIGPERDSHWYKEQVPKTEEEIDAAYKEYVEEKRSDRLDMELLDARRSDILFDMMNEEEIEKFLSLDYAYNLKTGLVRIREDAIIATQKETHTKTRMFPKDNDHFDIDDSAEDEADREVHFEKLNEVEKIEEMNEEQKRKKERIKDIAKEALESIGGAAMLSVAGGAIAGWISTLGGNGFGVNASLIAMPTVFAAMLGLIGASSVQDMLSKPRAIKEAKALGIYDLMVARQKALDDKYDYEKELSDKYHAYEDAKEYIKGRSK